MKEMRILVLVLFIPLSTIVCHSQGKENSKDKNNPTVRVQFTSETITVDGDLSESAWSTAETAGNFWMSFPVDDQRAKVEIQTEVRILNDRQNIYIGVICHDDDDYVIPTLKRDTDFPKGDGFGVVIDPVNEKTNGFVFGVNAAGAQTELLITGKTGRRENLEPGRTPDGTNIAWDNKWLSAVKNFPDHWVIEMAIPFKSLRFEDDKSVWGINFFRLDAGTNSIHTWSRVPIEFTELDLGYTGELIWSHPPKKVKNNISIIPYVLGSTYQDEESGISRENDFQAGVDGKLAITTSLNFDVTINPDFSQVEVDEQVTNLTLFDVRFPERRLFFLENSDIFEDFGIPPMRPFFSRRIGLDDEGNAIPIIYGARLSGNATNNLRIGLMNLQTKKTDEFLAQNYTAVAFHQQVFARSIIKGYFHNREAFDSPVNDYNRNAGLEFLYRSEDGRIQGFAGLAKSFSPGVNSRDLFYNFGFGYDNKNISAYTNLAGIGSNFKDDMGFFSGQEYYDAERDSSILIGYNHIYSRFSYTFYPEHSPKIISHQAGIRYILDLDTVLSPINNDLELNYNITFANTSLFETTFNHTIVDLLYPFSFIDQEPLPVNQYRFDYARITYETDQRKRFSLRAGYSLGSFYNGMRYQYILTLKYRAQPWGNFAINFEQNDLNFPDPYGGDKLLLISPRIEINFSKSLFWTTFLQYNTQNDNFNINSRFQWRFQPMSDIYLVYTDNYFVEFWGPKNRALVLKVNYWLNI